MHRGEVWWGASRGSVADAFFGVFHAGFRHNER
jgi:hypothetical protein